MSFNQEMNESVEHGRAVYIVEFRYGNLVMDKGLHVVRTFCKNTAVDRAQKAIDTRSKHASSGFLDAAGIIVTFFIVRACVVLGARIGSV